MYDTTCCWREGDFMDERDMQASGSYQENFFYAFTNYIFFLVSCG
jgi:hypothetical protein